jgi:2-amino-4-hydroxy-6-hydroxymethyldihydropteridine diphosphokinase
MKRPAYQTCLLLGSNIRPEYNLPLAVAALRQELTILKISQVWESAPVGGIGPCFLNAAVLAISHRSAVLLKQQILLPLEVRLGRRRSANLNSPRPIDLDIITFDQQLLDESVWENAYRAVPISELLPELLSSQGRPLREVAADLAAKTRVHLRTDVLL